MKALTQPILSGIFCWMVILCAPVRGQENISIHPHQFLKQAFSAPGFEGFFGIRDEANLLYLEHYSDDFVRQKTLQLTSKLVDVRVAQFFPLKDRLCIVGVKKVAAGRFKLNAVMIDLKTFEQACEPRELMEVKYKPLRSDFESIAREILSVNDFREAFDLPTGRLLVEVSNDREQIAFLYAAQTAQGKAIERHLVVCNRNLKTRWEKQKTKFFPDTHVRLSYMHLADDGTLYLVGSHKTAVAINGVEQYQTHLLGMYDEGTDLREFKLPAGTKSVYSPFINTDAENNLIITAFYREPFTTALTTQGVYYASILASTKNVEATQITPFDDAFKLKYYNAQGMKKATKAIASNKLKKGWQVIPRNAYTYANGEVFLVGEEFYFDNKYGDAFGRGEFPMLADLLLMRIDETGKVLWKKKVPKRQFGYADSHVSSVASGDGETRLHVMFTDHVRNKTHEPGKALSIARADRNSAMTTVSITASGDLRKTWLQEGDLGAWIYPEESWNLRDQNYLIFEGKVNGKKVTGKLELE